MERIIELQDIRLAAEVLGSYSKNSQTLEQRFDVSIEPHPSGLRISGEAMQVEQAQVILKRLIDLAEGGIPVTDQLTTYLSDSALDGHMDQVSTYNPDWVALNSKGKPIRSKTAGQSVYVDAIRNNTITFATGPAGTGKTYLAVALAVNAFRSHEVDRIILTRPAVEAGEKLGFLPGDLQMKVDPYMRPLYDSLHDLMGAEHYLKNMERTLIEVSPLAYMRGRTLDNAFIILDEAQNTTPEQMKMFLTRIGFNSKVVVTGDITQIDLESGSRSGLIEIRKILKNINSISFVDLDKSDVVRNSIVQRIIEAYETHEGKRTPRHERHERQNRERS